MRSQAKSIVGANDFFEVFVSTNLDTCEKRDVKGLYKKARKGEIQEFTGVSSPFEPPQNPNLILDTENKSIKEIGDLLVNELQKIIQ